MENLTGSLLTPLEGMPLWSNPPCIDKTQQALRVSSQLRQTDRLPLFQEDPPTIPGVRTNIKVLVSRKNQLKVVAALFLPESEFREKRKGAVFTPRLSKSFV